MPIFRRKPLVVEARQLTADNAKDICDWVYGEIYRAGLHVPGLANVAYEDDGRVVIRTREGEMWAEPGDWIIQEPNPVKDRLFYPCKPEIFEAGYDLEQEDVHAG